MDNTPKTGLMPQFANDEVFHLMMNFYFETKNEPIWLRNCLDYSQSMYSETFS